MNSIEYLMTEIKAGRTGKHKGISPMSFKVVEKRGGKPMQHLDLKDVGPPSVKKPWRRCVRKCYACGINLSTGEYAVCEFCKKELKYSY